MIRFFFRLVVMALANALGLIVAASTLDGMGLESHGFLIAVGVFTAVHLLAQPALTLLGLQQVTALAGSSALIATLLALFVTNLVSDGLTIHGLSTWLLATVIVWAVSLFGGLLLPVVFFKRWLGDDPKEPKQPKQEKGQSNVWS